MTMTSASVKVMTDDLSATTVHLSSEAVQIQERLLLNLRRRLAGDDQQNEGWRITTNGKVILCCLQFKVHYVFV